MSEPIRVSELLGGPLNGNEAFWFDPHKDVQEISYPLQTGSVRTARYRLVKGKVQGQPFLAYVDNDLGRADALSLIAGKLIQIDSIG
ncbi:hypothetical protein [Pseudomonas nitroreducens]|uniref:hypothetical protein n=1 Tax=Pseudomonas nitroreducens TaxID=46680 RepID=UPI00351D00D0